MKAPPFCRIGLAAMLAAGGCAQPTGLGTVHPAIADALLANAAEQVKRCYRAPRIARSGRQIITNLLVRYNPDGTLAGLPAVLSQSGVTPDNRVYAGRMAEAARLAVIRCAPLRLPPEQHARIWSFFTLTFSPRARA
jgi:hypothetical protein